MSIYLYISPCVLLSGRKSSFGREHHRSNSDSLRPIKGSASCHDLLSVSAYHPGPAGLRLASTPAGSCSSLESLAEAGEPAVGAGTGAGAGAGTQAVSSGSKPEVTGVSPKEGPIEGGTKVGVIVCWMY
jgi:hypothetical protein